MRQSLSKALRSLRQLSFWQRAIPVFLIVLGCNIVVQFRWFQDSFPLIHRTQLVFHRILCSVVPRMIDAKVVRIVKIDDTLHQQLGDPTNRAFLGNLITNIADGHALVIVLDFKLIVPPGRRAGNDDPKLALQNASLLKAIFDATNRGIPVIVPCWLQKKKDGIYERIPGVFVDQDLPLSSSNSGCGQPACARIGNINLPTDERQVPLVTSTWPADDLCGESLSLATVSAYEDAIYRSPKTENKKTIRSAIADRKFVYSSFIREHDFQTTSAQEIADRVPAAISSCNGRIVIIGGEWHVDRGYGDSVDTYLTAVGPMAGVYLHANYIESLLDDRFQGEVPFWLGLLLDLLIGVALYHFFHTADSTKGKLMVLGVFFIPLIATYIVFANLNFYLDFILPLGICFVHLTAEFIEDYIHIRKNHQRADLTEASHVKEQRWVVAGILLISFLAIGFIWENAHREEIQKDGGGVTSIQPTGNDLLPGPSRDPRSTWDSPILAAYEQPVPHKVNVLIADQVQLMIEEEDALEAEREINQDSSKNPPPPEFNPNYKIYIVNKYIDVGGCALTPGDVISLTSKHEAHNSQLVSVFVLSSKKGACPVDSTKRFVSIADLQDMQDEFRKKMDEGLRIMAERTSYRKEPKRDLPPPARLLLAAKLVEDFRVQAFEAPPDREIAAPIVGSHK